jgi:transcription elongation factor
MTLVELLADEATGLPGVVATTGPDRSITWTRNDRPFATASADGSTAEFALDPAVAAAAIRTPDVTSSSRGPGWVAFSPPDLDDHAADRAVAWLASAHRRLELRN